MAPKVLVVLTSYGRIESADAPTGWYLVRPPGMAPFPFPSLPSLPPLSHHKIMWT